MTKKIFCLTLVMLFALNAVAFADVKKTKTKAAQGNQLIALLPASDGVIAVDVQRLLSEALPQILSASPQKLGEANAALEDIKSRTGLDVRQFEQIAIGVNLKTGSTDPVMLARGKYNAAALLAVIKLATSGKHREEKIGDRSVYVFSIKELAGSVKAKAATNSVLAKIFETVLKNMPDELAVTAFDAKTLALGSAARLRETFETKTKVGADVLAMVNRKPNAIVSFGANTPNGLTQFVELEDELGATLAAVRQIHGALDVGGQSATLAVTAKTLDAEKATFLKDTMETAQQMFGGLLGRSNREDQKVYSRLLKGAKITQTGTQVAVDLQVPQSDINILLGVK